MGRLERDVVVGRGVAGAAAAGRDRLEVALVDRDVRARGEAAAPAAIVVAAAEELDRVGHDLAVRVLSGRDPHHLVEAQFKAVARALRDAIADDPRESGVPSTKGTL